MTPKEICEALVDFVNDGKETSAVSLVKGLTQSEKAEVKKLLLRRVKVKNSGCGSWDKGTLNLTRIFGGGEPHQY